MSLEQTAADLLFERDSETSEPSSSASAFLFNEQRLELQKACVLVAQIEKENKVLELTNNQVKLSLKENSRKKKKMETQRKIFQEAIEALAKNNEKIQEIEAISLELENMVTGGNRQDGGLDELVREKTMRLEQLFRETDCQSLQEELDLRSKLAEAKTQHGGLQMFLEEFLAEKFPSKELSIESGLQLLQESTQMKTHSGTINEETNEDARERPIGTLDPCCEMVKKLAEKLDSLEGKSKITLSWIVDILESREFSAFDLRTRRTVQEFLDCLLSRNQHKKMSSNSFLKAQRKKPLFGFQCY